MKLCKVYRDWVTGESVFVTCLYLGVYGGPWVLWFGYAETNTRGKQGGMVHSDEPDLHSVHSDQLSEQDTTNKK